MSFITLRDASGIAQVIVKGELNQDIGEISRQSVISVTGTVQNTKARDFAFEINAESIEIFGKGHSSAAGRPNRKTGEQHRHAVKPSRT